MKKIRLLQLGTVCVDSATQLEGTLTHWIMNMDGSVVYLFQPKGVNDEGLPVNKLCLELARLKIKEKDFEDVEVPFEILGTQVTSKASGYTGMAVEFVRHINGCFHVVVQPKGLSTKTKMPIKKCEFDLRECTGDKIVEMQKAELEASKKSRPSPSGDYQGRDLPPNVQ